MLLMLSRYQPQKNGNLLADDLATIKLLRQDTKVNNITF